MPNGQDPVYAVFAGPIDQSAVERFFRSFSQASQGGVPHIHLLMQSQGGNAADGVCLFHFLRTVPVPTTLYNAGAICSAAAVAYLGCPNRVTSKMGTFMIHRVNYNTMKNLNLDAVRASAEALEIEDSRIAAIIDAHVKLSEDQRERQRFADVWFTAEQAVEAGIAQEIGDFAPPMGTPLYSI